MNRIEALELELAARKLVEGTELHWWEVVRQILWGSQKFHYFIKEPILDGPRESYELAVAIIEGRPAFVDDVLYTQSGMKYWVGQTMCSPVDVPLSHHGIPTSREFLETLSWNQPAIVLPEGFIPWTGGDCPVHPKDTVAVMLRNGCESGFNKEAQVYMWTWGNNGGDIIGYKVIMKYNSIEPARPGERYVGGIIHPDGRICHTFLLPGDDLVPDWDAGMSLAKEKGGDLPSRIEQAMMFSFMPEEFQKEAYWSNSQHAGRSRYAWYQDLINGNQFSSIKYFKLRVRAVRREWEGK